MTRASPSTHYRQTSTFIPPLEHATLAFTPSDTPSDGQRNIKYQSVLKNLVIGFAVTTGVTALGLFCKELVEVSSSSNNAPPYTSLEFISPIVLTVISLLAFGGGALIERRELALILTASRSADTEEELSTHASSCAEMTLQPFSGSTTSLPPYSARPPTLTNLESPAFLLPEYTEQQSETTIEMHSILQIGIA